MYREKVAALHEALADPAMKDEAFGIIRTLIDEVRLVPENGELRVELRGALACILALGAQNNKTAGMSADGSVSWQAPDECSNSYVVNRVILGLY